MRQIKHQNTYEADFYAWAKTQSTLLKQRDFSKIDLKHIIEEIDSLGRSERSALKNQMIRLLMHLLKIKYQAEKHTKSWDKSIGNARLAIERIVEENPSLKRELKKVLEESYPHARKKAHIETGLKIETFPKECPWTLKDVL